MMCDSRARRVGESNPKEKDRIEGTNEFEGKNRKHKTWREKGN